MITIKNRQQIEGIRRSSRLAAQVIDFLSSYVIAGTSTQKLNNLAHDFITKHNAIPAPLNYGGFPKSICTSINNVVCHGIPSDKDILKNGDIVNVDVTTILDGFYGDISRMFTIGQISPVAQKLVQATQEALDKSIKSLAPGKFLNDCVGRIIEPYVEQFGFSVVRELGGHGVGLKFHEEPFVYHFDTHRNDTLLKPGMIFTIEPMINASTNPAIEIDRSDGWTVRTADGSLSAQFEDTILVTDYGHEVLTRP